jgi:5-methylcytosine-specific restriction endonuclease McrA
MKKIDILGKRNQDKMKQMADPAAVIEKKVPKNRSAIPDEYYAPNQALGLAVLKASVETTPNPDQALGLLPLPESTITTLPHILREIDLKRKAYIYQDKQHAIYDARFSITTGQIVELLVSCELLCYYCREICLIAYKESMCRKQWTLDRIDNDYGHNDKNVVIACLDCNLKRGTMDSERFRQGKQFTFRKIE